MIMIQKYYVEKCTYANIIVSITTITDHKSLPLGY
jgi:hypothetical protein